MKTKEILAKLIKSKKVRYIAGGYIIFVLGFSLGQPSKSDQVKINSYHELNAKIETLMTEKSELTAKVEQANAWFELSEDEQKEVITKSEEKKAEEDRIRQEEEAAKKAEQERIKQEEEAKKAEEEARAKEEKALSLERNNAIKKAESYLRYTAFSRQELISQLEFEGFSNEISTYAVDNVTVNWNEQAAKKAESYLKYSSFSRQGLYDQLAFEGFDHEQIEYGLTAVGY